MERKEDGAKGEGSERRRERVEEGAGVGGDVGRSGVGGWMGDGAVDGGWE